MTNVRKLNNSTLIILGEKVPSRNVGGIKFVVHPSVVHLVDLHEVLHPWLSSTPSSASTIIIINCYSPTSAADESKLDAYKHLEVVIRKEIFFYKFAVSDFNAKNGMKGERERCGDLGQNYGMRMVTVLLGSYPQHTFS
ncbi:unnamed protein product [Strongylus vulgaris]|uniref:Endonuclease/exonuclease/phosphatase domain-containing protein n=1 Tax=Strongylus vulgaris TaxID=40348 RepID=A0A3P7JGI8_STRVU|nr:unnamed protein product [Strongylus vulgaris]